VAPSRPDPDEVLDTVGLLCPQPIIETQEKVREMGPGRVIEVISDDVGILADMPAWCEGSGHTLLAIEEDEKGRYHSYVRVKKGVRNP
jgi:TusA-related sulfurtransferase